MEEHGVEVVDLNLSELQEADGGFYQKAPELWNDYGINNIGKIKISLFFYRI